jgi:hypothetical protein
MGNILPAALPAFTVDKPIVCTVAPLLPDNESRPLDMNGHWMAKGLKMKG